MSKLIKNQRIKELERQARGLTVLFSSLNTWSEYADNMLTELNHALPDPEQRQPPKTGDMFEALQSHPAGFFKKGDVFEVCKVNGNTNKILFVGDWNGYFTDCDFNVYIGGADKEAMRPIPKHQEPQLNQLDQSVFNGLDKKWRFAAVDKNGEVWVYSGKPNLSSSDWFVDEPVGMAIGEHYDTLNWQNSLIERDKVELTGSDLCRAMLERGDKHIMCFIGDLSDSAAIKRGLARIVTGIYKGRFETNNTAWSVAIPINSQGKPLTQSDVGL